LPRGLGAALVDDACGRAGALVFFTIGFLVGDVFRTPTGLDDLLENDGGRTGGFVDVTIGFLVGEALKDPPLPELDGVGILILINSCPLAMNWSVHNDGFWLSAAVGVAPLAPK
jgi:hypothetical protein